MGNMKLNEIFFKQNLAEKNIDKFICWKLFNTKFIKNKDSFTKQMNFLHTLITVCII